MFLVFLISIIVLSPWIAWETHRHFSRTAFWSFAAAVVAVNAILFATGCYLALELVDLPGLIVTAPLFISFSPPSRFVAVTVPPTVLAVTALAWGYVGGRVVGAAIARRTGLMKGCCSACGYNLTGNASGICPECGAKVPPRRVRRVIEAMTEQCKKLNK